MGILGHLFLTSFDEQIVDARCSAEGMLFVSDPATVGGWSYIPDMTFPAGGELHAYDYPLFYRDIRLNAWQRVDAFLREQKDAGGAAVASPPQEREACSCGLRCAGRFMQHCAVVGCGVWAVVALLLVPCHLPMWCCWRKAQRHVGGPCQTSCASM